MANNNIDGWVSREEEIARIRKGLSHDEDLFIYHQYLPPGTKEGIASGTSAWIALVDDNTVLKYPLEPGGDDSQLKTEFELLSIVGKHPHIIGLRRFAKTGLYLERAANGTIYQYLEDNHQVSLHQRLIWCRELTSAVAHIHQKRVIHCDIQPTNVLLDGKLQVKLADFQGNYLSEDGQVILQGGSAEPCRFSLPRDDLFEASFVTDIFALGSMMYFIINGHYIFPDINDGVGNWKEEIRDRFKNGRFPVDSYLCSDIVLRCLRQQYTSATEVAKDIEDVMLAYIQVFAKEL